MMYDDKLAVVNRYVFVIVLFFALVAVILLIAYA